MIDGVSIDDVLQKRDELYNLERQFRDAPFSKWFVDLKPMISSKIKTIEYDSINNTLIDIYNAINAINRRLKDISVSIVQTLPPAGNLNRDQIKAVFGHNDLYVVLVYEEFCHMLLAMKTFLITVETCTERFKNQIYEGKESEIVEQIQHLINYTPSGRTVPGMKINKWKNLALKPLQKLPPTNGPVYDDFFARVRAHYKVYQRIRMKGHKSIEQMKKEISLQAVDGLLKI